MDTLKELKRLITRRKKELEYFDSLPKEEQERLTKKGYNPHEDEATRSARKKHSLEQRKKEFNALPKKEREILRAFGYDPNDEVEKIIYRKDLYK